MKLNRYTTYNRSLKGRYRELKRRAKRDNITLSISPKQYENITAKEICYYCDTSLKDTTGSGLNRINSNMGYTVNNVKPCCGICNQIISNLTNAELLARLYKIARRIK